MFKPDFHVLYAGSEECKQPWVYSGIPEEICQFRTSSHHCCATVHVNEFRITVHLGEVKHKKGKVERLIILYTHI